MKHRNMKLVMIVLLVAIIGLITAIVQQSLQYREYTKVQAEIISVSSQKGTSAKTNMSYSYYVTYKYHFKGVEYQATKKIFTKTGKTIGEKNTIRINPENPKEIANTYTKNGCIGLAVFFSAILVLLFVSERSKRKR